MIPAFDHADAIAVRVPRSRGTRNTPTRGTGSSVRAHTASQRSAGIPVLYSLWPDNRQPSPSRRAMVSGRPPRDGEPSALDAQRVDQCPSVTAQSNTARRTCAGQRLSARPSARCCRYVIVSTSAVAGSALATAATIRLACASVAPAPPCSRGTTRRSAPRDAAAARSSRAESGRQAPLRAASAASPARGGRAARRRGRRRRRHRRWTGGAANAAAALARKRQGWRTSRRIPWAIRKVIRTGGNRGNRSPRDAVSDEAGDPSCAAPDSQAPARPIFRGFTAYAQRTFAQTMQI